MSIDSLQPPDFTDDEQDQIVTDLMALTKLQIREFLARVGLPRSGTKKSIRSCIEIALSRGTLTLPQVVQFLDEVIPWGKQHVFLYNGPRTSIADWKKTEWLAKLLRQRHLGKLLNASLPLVLPEKMKVSSIVHDARRLRITAIKRRDWWERNQDYDSTTVTKEGDDVELRAFVHRVTRSLVAFEWDFIANTAFLQISQLPRGFRYEHIAQEFVELVKGWLDLSQFSVVDLQQAIKKLHELEEAGTGETRSHGITYQTLERRRFEGKSGSPTAPLLGDVNIDAALSALRKTGMGHLGNFYWLPGRDGNPRSNPLVGEIHLKIVGAHNRVNFPTPNVEETVRYVLSRIRSHCS